MPGIKLIGNVTIAVVLVYGGYRVIDGAVDGRRAGRLPAVPAPVLRADAGDVQFYNTLQSASAALEKLSGVLDEKPTVAEPVTGRATSACPGPR